MVLNNVSLSRRQLKFPRGETRVSSAVSTFTRLNFRCRTGVPTPLRSLDAMATTDDECTHVTYTIAYHNLSASHSHSRVTILYTFIRSTFVLTWALLVLLRQRSTFCSMTPPSRGQPGCSLWETACGSNACKSKSAKKKIRR